MSNPIDRQRVIVELAQQFVEEGCCPVCGHKKKKLTEKHKSNLSKAMKAPRKRSSPTTAVILKAIKAQSKEFSIQEIVNSTNCKVNTVREIVRRLILAGEISTTSDRSDTRMKSKKFGTSNFWKELEREGEVPLKSLPKE